MRSAKKINILIIGLLLIFICFIFDSIIEDKQINSKVQEFKNRGILVYETSNKHYYEVKRKYEYEDTNSPILRSYGSDYFGTTGDIYISNRDPLDFFVTEKISKHIYIGHSGMVYDADAKYTIEIVGNKEKENNVLKLWENNWLRTPTNNYVFLRVKGMDNEKKEKLIANCQLEIGKPFNYTILFNNKNKFYCSDFISYIYDTIDINLNTDYFATTGADYITNDETYLIYYQETIYQNNEQHYNIYYLTGGSL